MNLMTLFGVYINDLLCELKASNIGIEVHGTGEKIPVLAYADDIVLLASNKAELQMLLDIVHKWCSKWQVRINTNKSKVMHFRKRRAPQDNTVFHLGEPLETVGKYRYLGLTLDSYLDMAEGIEQNSKAASRALGGVIGHTKPNCELSYGVFSKLFEACIKPILLYGSGAWFTGQKCCKLDGVQSRAIRYFCGVPKTTPTLSLIGDMGWTPGGSSERHRKLMLLQSSSEHGSRTVNKKGV